jgi:hypothetical protein
MSEEKLGGFGVRRKEWYKTKNGIVLFLKEGEWSANLPDGWKEFGITFAELVSFLAYLNEDKTLEEAREKAGWKQTIPS